MLKHICPYCKSRNLTYRERPALHILRALGGWRTRYCRDCKQKWKVWSHRSSNAARDIVFVGIAAGVGFFLFTMIAPMNSPYSDSGGGHFFKEESISEGMLSLVIDNIYEYDSGHRDSLKPLREEMGRRQRKTAGLKASNSKGDISQEKMMAKARDYLRRYKSASSKDRQKIIQEAKNKYRKYLQ